MNPDTILWKSGGVKRWHCSLDRALRESGDTTASHQWRCAMLLMMLHPLPSAHLLACVLTHDVPEIVTGDVPGPAKAGMLGEVLAMAEAQVAESFGLPMPTDKDTRWLSLVDRLDAYLWAREHAPYVLKTSAWMSNYAGILALSDTLGVREKVEALV
jgi:hypothetical protein